MEQKDRRIRELEAYMIQPVKTMSDQDDRIQELDNQVARSVARSGKQKICDLDLRSRPSRLLQSL